MSTLLDVVARGSLGLDAPIFLCMCGIFHDLAVDESSSLWWPASHRVGSHHVVPYAHAYTCMTIAIWKRAHVALCVTPSSVPLGEFVSHMTLCHIFLILLSTRMLLPLRALPVYAAFTWALACIL
jgi:hypothetical protein